MQPINGNHKTIKYLTQDEVRRIFSKITDKCDRALFNVIYKYGLRVSEVGLLRIQDVDLERRKISIQRLKGGISGEYGVLSDTARLIRAYLKEREEDFYPALFLSRKKDAISRKTIHDLFQKYARNARLPQDKCHAHTLRHSIAVHMLDAGATQEEVKDHLGHKYIQTTDIYAAISGRKKKQVFERMERAREILLYQKNLPLPNEGYTPSGFHSVRIYGNHTTEAVLFSFPYALDCPFFRLESTIFLNWYSPLGMSLKEKSVFRCEKWPSRIRPRE